MMYDGSGGDNADTRQQTAAKSALFYVLLGVIARLRRAIFQMARSGGYASLFDERGFADMAAGAEFSPYLAKDGFIYAPLADRPLRIVNWGLPDGQLKLEIPAGGIRIDLPQGVNWVQVRSAHYAPTPLIVQGYDDEQLVAQSTTQMATPQLQTLVLQAERINRMCLLTEDGESLLYTIAVPKGPL